MKLGAVTMAFRDEATIRGTLACLNPFVDKHIVMLNERPYFGNSQPPDNTESICREFDKVDVIKGNWEEHILRNIGINLCSDCDWMIGFDADEMITQEDMYRLIGYLETVKLDAVGFISKVYWNTTDYIFYPDPDHVKVCIVRPNSSIRYYEKQCINGPFETLDYHKAPFITHHHLSYCAPKDILNKVLNYAHANEFDGLSWWNKRYKHWEFGQPVVQPFGTIWEAKHDPLPEELKKLLEPVHV